MIRGYHVVFGAYGFWLPNDPRGSWSQYVGSRQLYGTSGRATKTTTRSSLAYRPHDRDRRVSAKKILARPAVQFTGKQARAVGQGFAEYIGRAGLVIWACAVLPDHVHLVLAPHRLDVEQLVIQLKGAATKQLTEEVIHPFRHLAEPGSRPPKCFARGEWVVYLETPGEILRALRYVEGNPRKENKPRQRWKFIVPYRV